MMRRFTLFALCLAACFPIFAMAARENENKKAKPKFELVDAATPADTIHVPDGFKVELLYSVPKEEEGSWVNICYDPKGRLIVSDQYGSLYRLTPPKIGSSAKPKIEKIPVDI